MKKFLPLLFVLLLCQTLSVRSQALIHPAIPKRIALTFDACMTSGMIKRVETGKDQPLFNAEIITYLQQEKIPATIFITGLWAKKYPAEVKAIAADPLFEIGNHSYGHKAFVTECYSLPILAENEKETDLRKSQEILTRLTGKKPRLFRFPGGCYQPDDLKLLEKFGLKMVGWTFASGYAFNSNAEAIVQNVLEKAKTGAIVVFHLSGGRYAPKSAEVIKTIVPELRKRGFEFVTVSRMMNYNFTSLKQN